MAAGTIGMQVGPGTLCKRRGAEGIRQRGKGVRGAGQGRRKQVNAIERRQLVGPAAGLRVGEWVVQLGNFQAQCPAGRIRMALQAL